MGYRPILEALRRREPSISTNSVRLATATTKREARSARQSAIEARRVVPDAAALVSDCCEELLYA